MCCAPYALPKCFCRVWNWHINLPIVFSVCVEFRLIPVKQPILSILIVSFLKSLDLLHKSFDLLLQNFLDHRQSFLHYLILSIQIVVFCHYCPALFNLLYPWQIFPTTLKRRCYVSMYVFLLQVKCLNKRIKSAYQ